MSALDTELTCRWCGETYIDQPGVPHIECEHLDDEQAERDARDIRAVIASWFGVGVGDDPTVGAWRSMRFEDLHDVCDPNMATLCDVPMPDPGDAEEYDERYTAWINRVNAATDKYNELFGRITAKWCTECGQQYAGWIDGVMVDDRDAAIRCTSTYGWTYRSHHPTYLNPTLFHDGGFHVNFEK